MAQLQSTSITGSFNLTTNTAVTGSSGYLWFNTTTNRLTYSYCGGVWSSGGAMIVARQSLAGAGTSTAVLAFGGITPTPATTLIACTEVFTTFPLTCTFIGPIVPPPYTGV